MPIALDRDAAGHADDESAAGENAEAREHLLSLAVGHSGNIPARALVDLVLRVTEGGDHPLRMAALDAALRRLKSARQAEGTWKIVAPRQRKAGLGLHRIDVGAGKQYEVLVRSFGELAGSCDCLDFQKNALGLCKHLGWLLARGFDKEGLHPKGSLPAAMLAWDPVRPLTGAGDWLWRVRWAGGRLPQSLAPHFGRKPGTLNSGDAPGQASAGSPAKASTPAHRLVLVQALRKFIGPRGVTSRRADPELAALLRREESILLRSGDAPAEKEIRTALAHLRRKLFPYQEEGVRRFLATGRLLLADDMGLGKTAQAIAGCHVLHATGRVKKGLIIVPAALKPQWLREWKLFTALPAAILDGTPAERARQLRTTRSGFLIVNYEQVLRDLPGLVAFRPDLVVLDEAQRIKNWAAKTSAYVKRLQPAWRLVLTGTPLENRLTELASLLEWIDDRALEPAWRLPVWHAVRADGKREVVGARNLGTLRARIEPCTLRRIRREVLTQLPPRTDTRVPVELTPEQTAAHAEFDLPIARLISIGRGRPLSQGEFLRLMTMMAQQRVICNGLAQRDFEEVWPRLDNVAPTEAALRGLFSPKLTELRNLLANLVVTQGRKVVVFSQWKRMLHLAKWAASDVLAGAGLRGVSFTGDESQKRRTQNVIDFHDDPAARVFFATDAGGVGLNLQRAASACIHLDLPWNPAVLEQRSGRIYRFGQKDPVEIYALVATSGIESRIASLVGDKKALFDGLFDGSSDEVAFEKDGSFLAGLQKLVDAPVVPDLPATSDDDDEAEPEPEGDVQDAAPQAAPDPQASASPSASASVPATAPASASAPEAAAPVAADLLAGITVKKQPDGRMVVEAAPEAAKTLAAMLEGLAGMLRAAAGQ